MSPKAAVVVGLVVVALFVVVVTTGDGREGSGRERNGLLDRLGERAGDPAAVPDEAVETDCRDDDDRSLLEFTGACGLLVTSNKELAVLRLVAGTAVAVEAPAPDGDVEVEADLDAGEATSVAVGEGETVIRLTCPGLGTCRVHLTADDDT